MTAIMIVVLALLIVAQGYLQMVLRFKLDQLARDMVDQQERLGHLSDALRKLNERVKDLTERLLPGFYAPERPA